VARDGRPQAGLVVWCRLPRKRVGPRFFPPTHFRGNLRHTSGASRRSRATCLLTFWLL